MLLERGIQTELDAAMDTLEGARIPAQFLELCAAYPLEHYDWNAEHCDEIETTRNEGEAAWELKTHGTSRKR